MTPCWASFYGDFESPDDLLRAASDFQLGCVQVFTLVDV